MDKKTVISCLLVATVIGGVFFSFASERYYKHIHEAFAQLSFKRNMSAHYLFRESPRRMVDSIGKTLISPVSRPTNEDNSPNTVTSKPGARPTNEDNSQNTVTSKPGARPTNESRSKDTVTIKPGARPKNEDNFKSTVTITPARPTNESNSKDSASITIGMQSIVSTLANVTKSNRPNGSIKYEEKIRKVGLESIAIHDFKSRYIIDTVIYENDTIAKVPGKRKTKIISCFNCPTWFKADDFYFGHNRDFKKCPYSECYFDYHGATQTKADMVLFFPIPREFPFRPQGQIWTYCSWESPIHYGYPSPYSKWRDAFNWTMSFRQDADIFAPNNRFSWRAKEKLMNDSEYLRFAKSKTKTAAWFVSNCQTQSRRHAYVRRMQHGAAGPYEPLAAQHENYRIHADFPLVASLKKAVVFCSSPRSPERQFSKFEGLKSQRARASEGADNPEKIIDIDIYGRCSKKKCVGQDCLRMLNDTYKFYLSFENSFCEDYVTEKLFRNFDFRLQIIPVARGGFDYQKYIPPNVIVDASKFESPEALAEYLKELGDDLPRYTAMLKEKDKLTIVNYKYDWCELCEKLHKEDTPKTIKDIKKLTHHQGVCWPPKL